jgi:hypothetical protein
MYRQVKADAHIQGVRSAALHSTFADIRNHTMTAEDLLYQYEPAVAERGMLLRRKLFALLPDIRETVDESARILGYGYGPGYKDSVCTIIPSKKGIKLGFYKGVELPDPAGLLEGTGKVHKYVSIKTDADIDSEPLKLLLMAGLAAYELRKTAK